MSERGGLAMTESRRARFTAVDHHGAVCPPGWRVFRVYGASGAGKCARTVPTLDGLPGWSPRDAGRAGGSRGWDVEPPKKTSLVLTVRTKSGKVSSVPGRGSGWLRVVVGWVGRSRDARMTWQLSDIIDAVAMSRERRRRAVSAFATAGATWTAASAGFAEAPSPFQLIMLGAAAALTAGVVAFSPGASAPPAELKKPRYCKVSIWPQPFACESGAALKKPVKLRLGL